MKTTRIQSCLTVAMAVVLFLGVTTMTSGQQEKVTVVTTVQTNVQPVGETNETIPAIVFQDIPMLSAIENLARQADINFIVDGRLIKWWLTPDSPGGNFREPIVNINWKNLTARQALQQLLKQYNLALLEDPFTSIARVTYTNQIVNPDEASLIADETNPLVGDTNDSSFTKVYFTDIPITSVIENLARQSSMNFLFDPTTGYGKPDKYGQIKTEPSVSVRWDNVTPKRALVSICENYQVTIIKIPESGIYLIRAKDHPVNFVVASLLGSDTNDAAIPKIYFQDIPLDDVFKNLIKQGQVDVMLDLIGPKFVAMPDESLRWENITPRQAIVALCENYDLVIVKDTVTGAVCIKPKD